MLARTVETLESALAQLSNVAGRPCLYLIDNRNPGELADLPAPSDAEFDNVVLKRRCNVGIVTISPSNARTAAFI